MPDERMVTVLWLLPAEPARGALRALVARLAEECDAPVFEPHLTLGLGTPAILGGTCFRRSRTRGRASLRKIARGVIRLRTRGVGFTPQFTKTLFVRLEYSAALRSLRNSLGMENSGAFDPHISVLYRELTEARQAELARSVALPFTSVLFDSLALIRCPDPTNSRADVESWEVVASRKPVH